MNILYLNHYAGSPRHGMEYRPYYLAREWVQAGHAVRMLAADFSHVRARQPDQAGTRHHELIDGIDYHWYPTPVYAGNGLGRVKNIWRFLRQVWREAGRIVREFRPDIVIASSTYPMDIWVAHRIVKLARQQGLDCRLVFEVHDLWPLSPIELGGMSPSHPFIRLCQAAEDYAYRHADVVVSMLPKVAGHMQDHGLDLRKLHIVPNGITLDEWQGNPPPLREDVAQHMRACKQAGLQLVGYAGSHGTPNALDVMLQAAALLRDAPLAFVLVGDGHEKAALQAQAQQLGLQNVAFSIRFPRRRFRPSWQ